MTDPAQILNCTEPANGYRNDYYPWRDGVFTTCVSWVQTIVGKGQRPQWVKHKPESGTWTEPPRESFSSLVFMTKRVNGLVDWHVFDLSKMSDEQVYAIEQRFVLDEYQRKVINDHFNGETAELALPAVPVQVGRAPRKTAVSKSEQIAQALAAHFPKTGKPFNDDQLQQLRDLANESAHSLPGVVKPWQLDKFPPLRLAQDAATEKVDFDAYWADKIASATPDTLESVKAMYRAAAARNAEQIEWDKTANTEWYALELERQATGVKAPSVKPVKVIDADSDDTTGMSPEQLAIYNMAMGRD